MLKKCVIMETDSKKNKTHTTTHILSDGSILCFTRKEPSFVFKSKYHYY